MDTLNAAQCVPCSIAPFYLARWSNPIASCVNSQDGARTSSPTVLSFEHKVLLPQACGRLDIVNSNLPPSSSWLCEITGVGISAPLMVSEFTNGIDGAPSEII